MKRTLLWISVWLINFPQFLSTGIVNNFILGREIQIAWRLKSIYYQPELPSLCKLWTDLCTDEILAVKYLDNVLFWDSRLSSICHFNATTFALFPSSSINWRGLAFLSHWSDQFLYWCSNSILKIKCSMKVCFDQASLTREILYVPTWQVNDRWRDFDAILECGRQSVKWAFIASAPLRSLLPSSPLPFFSMRPPQLPLPFAVATQVIIRIVMLQRWEWLRWDISGYYIDATAMFTLVWQRWQLTLLWQRWQPTVLC